MEILFLKICHLLKRSFWYNIVLKIGNEQVTKKVMNKYKPFIDDDLLISESSALDTAWSVAFSAWEVYNISAKLFYARNYSKLI